MYFSTFILYRYVKSTSFYLVYEYYKLFSILQQVADITEQC